MDITLTPGDYPGQYDLKAELAELEAIDKAMAALEARYDAIQAQSPPREAHPARYTPNTRIYPQGPGHEPGEPVSPRERAAASLMDLAVLTAALAALTLHALGG